MAENNRTKKQTAIEYMYEMGMITKDQMADIMDYLSGSKKYISGLVGKIDDKECVKSV